jgi:hypothetical protein
MWEKLHFVRKVQLLLTVKQAVHIVTAVNSYVFWHIKPLSWYSFQNLFFFTSCMLGTENLEVWNVVSRSL